MNKKGTKDTQILIESGCLNAGFRARCERSIRGPWSLNNTKTTFFSFDPFMIKLGPCTAELIKLQLQVRKKSVPEQLSKSELSIR